MGVEDDDGGGSSLAHFIFDIFHECGLLQARTYRLCPLCAGIIDVLQRDY